MWKNKNKSKIGSFVLLMVWVVTACSTEEELQIDENVSEMTSEIAYIPMNSEMQESTEPASDEGGGNLYSSDFGENQIAVLVSEDNYYYENEPIELENLIAMIKEMDGEITVELMDDNATYNAYKKLTDALEKLEISIIEN